MSLKKKTSNLPSKAYKSLLGKAYIMILIIGTSIAVGFYIIQINDLLQKIYQVDSSISEPSTAVTPITQTAIDSLKSVHTSNEATVIELPTSGRLNPFN